jgi:hypothetical protein
MDRRATGPSVAAGVVAGLAGLAVFLLLHHLWIVPIWFIAPAGALMAAVGGAAVGAAHADLRPHLPRRPWAAIATAAVWTGVLAPALVIAEVRGPIFVMGTDGGGTLLVPASDVLVAFLVGLVGVSALTAAAIGAAVGRSRRAVATMTVAAIVVALGPGHNIPMLGGTAAVAKEVAVLGVVIAIAAVVLVEAEVWFARPRR